MIACHWHVLHEVAADFFGAFYREWLGIGRGRGDVWRAAVLASIRDAPTRAEAASRAGAFSLQGVDMSEADTATATGGMPDDTYCALQ